MKGSTTFFYCTPRKLDTRSFLLEMAAGFYPDRIMDSTSQTVAGIRLLTGPA